MFSSLLRFLREKIFSFQLKFSLLIFFSAAAALFGFKLYSINAYIWLPDYLFNSPSKSETINPTDVIFVLVDHWEPGGNMKPLLAWTEGYRVLAGRHIDGDGVQLQHTWYYPIDQFRGYEVDSLVSLCQEGYGEIEVHLHHQNDNSASLRKKLMDGIDSLHAHGALISSDGSTHFSFVHGNWALDNSREHKGRDLCGVNNEISILKELGCYADFTFPSLNQCSQPPLVNKIYYCIDDPFKSKSYERGVECQAGRAPKQDEFMIFEGTLMIDWADWRFKTHPTLDDGNLYWEIPTSLHRFELWLKANIHVKGKPEWVFVRPFTHGASLKEKGAYDNVLGTNIDSMLTEVEARYNDGQKYRLHYMTTREAYNVIKAAEAGMLGNPNEYRNFTLPRYEYLTPQIALQH